MFLFFPVGGFTAFVLLIIMLINKSRVAKASRQCPHCAETIKREASVCRYCGRDVEPAAAPTPLVDWQ